MQRSIIILSAFALGVVAAAGAGPAVAAADDLTIVSKNTRDGRPAGTSTSYLASDHVRIARDTGNETIVDLRTGIMTTLDGKKKTYFTVTKQDLADFGAKLKARMNTPEMKNAMNAMSGMSDSMASSFDVKRTGASRNVAGFHCEEWTVTMGPMSTLSECVTTDLQYPAHAFEAYKEFSENMRSTMGSFGPSAKASGDLAQKLKLMKGYPVASAMTIDIMGTKSKTEGEVVEIRRGSILPSVWEVPAGYTKIENPMLKSLESHGRSHP
jgi:hypothetical protein